MTAVNGAIEMYGKIAADVQTEIQTLQKRLLERPTVEGESLNDEAGISGRVSTLLKVCSKGEGDRSETSMTRYDQTFF